MNTFIPSRKCQVKSQSSLWITPACTADIAHGNLYFRLYLRDISSHKTCLFVVARNKCKRENEASNNFEYRDYWWLYNRVMNKCKIAIPAIFNQFEVLMSSGEAEYFARTFSSNSTLDSPGVSSLNFQLRTESLFRDIHITPTVSLSPVT